MSTTAFDVIVIGAGIAGATAAAHLAPDHRVALIEAEDAPGYHTTGRSAAVWILNYGPPPVRVMNALSRGFFESPPPGFTDTPLMSRRAVVTLCPAGQEADFAAVMDEGQGLRELPVAELRAMVPALRPDDLVAAAIEPDAFDMDVAAILQGFLRQVRAHDGVLALRSRAGKIARTGGRWDVEVTDGTVLSAPALVNAAGAWGDEIARIAGVRPIGLQPKRRTGLIIDPGAWQVADWPMLTDAIGSWYTRPEARTKLMVSPADETDMPPQDIQPDELDVAIAVDRMQQALDIAVHRVEHSWAGLRSFLPDRSMAIGWDRETPGFFWSIGQGGYGIQTSPAQGRLVADLFAHRDPGGAAGIVAAVDPNRFDHVSA